MQATGKIYSVFNNLLTIKVDKLGFEKDQVVSVWNRARRSLQSNKYYWALLNWAVDSHGGNLYSQGCLSPVELHDTLKQALGLETTTSLDDREFSEHIEKSKILLVTEYWLDVSVFEEIHGQLKGGIK